jgi:hypothetical protein
MTQTGNDPNLEAQRMDDIEGPAFEDSLATGANAEQGRALRTRLSQGFESRPLLGVLPLARVVPQDVHSVMDYLDAGGVMAGAFLDGSTSAKVTSIALGASGILTSALADYRLSLAKLIPIETHEAMDYAFGISAITAPFLLGYYKTSKATAALHIAIGLGTILTSAVTDYRAYRGVGRVRSEAPAGAE